MMTSDEKRAKNIQRKEQRIKMNESRAVHCSSCSDAGDDWLETFICVTDPVTGEAEADLEQEEEVDWVTMGSLDKYCRLCATNVRPDQLLKLYDVGFYN